LFESVCSQLVDANWLFRRHILPGSAEACNVILPLQVTMAAEKNWNIQIAREGTPLFSLCPPCSFATSAEYPGEINCYMKTLFENSLLGMTVMQVLGGVGPRIPASQSWSAAPRTQGMTIM
jgi:hypothetical protein